MSLDINKCSLGEKISSELERVKWIGQFKKAPKVTVFLSFTGLLTHTFTNSLDKT